MNLTTINSPPSGGICFSFDSFTGLGQAQCAKVLKNNGSSFEAGASGCRLTIFATKIAQLTPPRNPRTLPYNPCTLAHSLTARNVSRKFSARVASPSNMFRRNRPTRTPFTDLTDVSSRPTKTVSSTLISILSTSSSASLLLPSSSVER